MSSDPMDQVLAELSADSRALLELSVRRGIPDDEIASLLGTPESEVRSRREAVLQEVADSLGEEPDPELREQVAEHLGSRGNLFAPPPEATDDAAGRRRRRRLVPALIGGLVIAAVVALVLAIAGGGEEQPRRTSQLGPSAQLEPLPGMPEARARARLVQRAGRERLELRVRGLPAPEGAYGVWLYTSVNRARQIGTFPTGNIDLDAPLPADADRYRDIDISLEPADGNDRHSGDSYLRVPLARLRP